MAFGLDDALLLGGTAASLFAGDSEQDKADRLGNRASKFQLADMAARLPLRGMAIDRLLGPQAQRENLNSMFADAGNPYSQPLERPILPAPAQAGAPGAVLPGGVSAGEQYVQDTRTQGALAGGAPGDFRVNDWTQAAAYTGGNQGAMGQLRARAAEEARKKLAAEEARRSRVSQGGYGP